MKPSRYVTVFALLNALTFCLTASLVQAGEGNNKVQRGGKANSHKDGKAEANAQWAADPERGWVRAKERQEQNQATDKAKQDRDRHKTKGSKEKTHH
jgi:hypothetical protein